MLEKMYCKVFLLFICSIYSFAKAIEVVPLQGANFELTISSYKYIAVLLYDQSHDSRIMEKRWSLAASLVKSLPSDCAMAKVVL
jgi:hypothetical protein